jgi:hypothetical protein
MRRSLWGQSAVLFVRAVFRPVPGWNDAVNALASLAGVVGISILGGATAPNQHGQHHGFELWPWGVVLGLVVLVALVVWAGARSYHEQVLDDQVRIEVHALLPLVIPDSHVQLSARITNQGLAGDFRATISSDLRGVEYPSYGLGTVIAWEGENRKELHLGRGDTGTLRLARLHEDDQRRFRVIIPPSPDNPNVYGAGLPMVAPSGQIAFELTFRHVDRDVAFRYEATVQLDSGTGLPRFELRSVA